MPTLRAVRHGLNTAPTPPKLRAVRHGLTGGTVTTPKLRAVRHGLTGGQAVIVTPLPSYTGVEPGTALNLTASLVGGGAADSWFWRVVSGVAGISGTGASVTVTAPSDINGTTATIGVTATVAGVTSAEVTSTVSALPQLDWFWGGAGWLPQFESWSSPLTGPVTISAGGTYTLNILATDSTVPAVTISTTAPVTIDRSSIQHAGWGIRSTTGAQLTVTNSTFTAITPSIANSEQQHIIPFEAAKLVVQHNNFNYGHGIQADTGGNNTVQTNPLDISYNNFTDVGKLSQPGNYQGAIHLDKITAPNGVIQWNRVINHYGSTWGEDEFGFADTRGTAGNPLEIAHNLINGVYPISGDGAAFTGGAIDLGDRSGGYLNCHHCYVIGYTNNGIMQPTNSAGVTIDNCVAVYDGIADSGGATVSSTFGWGITVKNLYGTPVGTQSVVTNCRVGHRRWNGTAFETANYQWENQGTQDGGGNTTLTASAANEQAMVAEFEASVVAAGVTIGPT